MSFISSLAQNQTKCLFLNDDPCMVSLNKCTGSCNDLSPKICVPKKAKDINVKGFNMITNKDEAKAIRL